MPKEEPFLTLVAKRTAEILVERIEGVRERLGQPPFQEKTTPKEEMQAWQELQNQPQELQAEDIRELNALYGPKEVARYFLEMRSREERSAHAKQNAS